MLAYTMYIFNSITILVHTVYSTECHYASWEMFHFHSRIVCTIIHKLKLNLLLLLTLIADLIYVTILHTVSYLTSNSGIELESSV